MSLILSRLLNIFLHAHDDPRCGPSLGMPAHCRGLSPGPPQACLAFLRVAKMHVQVRAGEPVSQYDVVKFAQLFNDELTLDNLERIHLVNLCRFVGIQPFGTDAFLVRSMSIS